MNKQNTIGHFAAVFTIIVWGTTFISTKVLLEDFTPVEILFFRFALGFICLMLIYPKRMGKTNLKQELTFMAAGICGVTLYFLLENIALTYSYTTNVCVIISVAPFFTAIFSRFFARGEKLNGQFFVGFVAAMAGIILITFNGNMVLQLNPLGDILAFLAAVAWAAYSVLTNRISSFGYHTVQSTRRIFFYGLVFMVPTLFFFDFRLGFERFAEPPLLLNMVYLGLGASALCFVTWNHALKVLGAMKTSAYIYVVPVVTLITSAIFLDERVTPLAILGTAFTLLGLVISEHKPGGLKKLLGRNKGKQGI